MSSLDDTIDMSLTIIPSSSETNLLKTKQQLKSKSKPLLSSFQKHESKVIADLDDEYLKWPNTQPYMKHQYPGPNNLPKKTASYRSGKKSMLPHVQQAMERINHRNKSVTFESQDRNENSNRITAVIADELTFEMSVPPPLDSNLKPKTAPSPLYMFLNRAESLLTQVSRVLPADETLLEQVSKDDRLSTYDVPPIISTSSSKTLLDALPKSSFAASNEIELLLHGLDDVYDPEPEYDDDAITRILQTGGNPPSQLQFQSVYACNQRILNKLSTIKYLNIHLSHAVVYSMNFGIRKDITFFILKGPQGSISSTYNIDKIFFKSTPQISSTKPSSKFASKSSSFKGDSFLVGMMPIDASVSWEILLTDDVLQSWKHYPNDCISIELHSSILPPMKGVKTETTCFASATIPLSSLLGIESFSAVTTCEFQSNILIHEKVTARLQNLPTGYKLSSKSVAPKVASLSSRIWLQTYDESDVKSKELKQDKQQSVLLVSQPDLGAINNIPTLSIREGNREAAMTYLPQEKVLVEPTEKHVGVYFHSVVLHSPCCVLTAANLPVNTPLKVTILFKHTKTKRHVSEGYGMSTTSAYDVVFDLLDIKSLSLPSTEQHILLECWIEWIDPVTCKSFKKLIGTSQLSLKSSSDALLITDLLHDTQVGVIQARLCVDSEQAVVSQFLQDAHSFYNATASSSTSSTTATEPQESTVIKEAVGLVDLPPPHLDDSFEDITTSPTAHSNISSSHLVSQSLRSSVPSKGLVPTTKSRSRSAFPVVHVIDIHIANTWTTTQPSHDNDESLGVNIKYSFHPSIVQPMRDDLGSVSSDSTMFTLWWDNEARILNGRAQHKFNFPSLSYIEAFQQHGVLFEIVKDTDENASIGAAFLVSSMMSDVLATNGELTLSLPVMTMQGKHISDLKLSFIHHIEPALMRSMDSWRSRSVDSTWARMSIDSLSHEVLKEHLSTENEVTATINIQRCLHLPFSTSGTTEQEVYCECRWLEQKDTLMTSTSRKIAMDNVGWPEESLRLKFPFDIDDHQTLARYMVDLNLIVSVYLSSPYGAIGSILGTASVDLSMLAYGLHVLEGWYNVLDQYQICLGQIKLSLRVIKKNDDMIPHRMADTYYAVDHNEEEIGLDDIGEFIEMKLKRDALFHIQHDTVLVSLANELVEEDVHTSSYVADRVMVPTASVALPHPDHFDSVLLDDHLDFTEEYNVDDDEDISVSTTSSTEELVDYTADRSPMSEGEHSSHAQLFEYGSSVAMGVLVEDTSIVDDDDVKLTDDVIQLSSSESLDTSRVSRLSPESEASNGLDTSSCSDEASLGDAYGVSAVETVVEREDETLAISFAVGEVEVSSSASDDLESYAFEERSSSNHVGEVDVVITTRSIESESQFGSDDAITGEASNTPQTDVSISVRAETEAAEYSVVSSPPSTDVSSEEPSSSDSTLDSSFGVEYAHDEVNAASPTESYSSKFELDSGSSPTDDLTSDVLDIEYAIVDENQSTAPCFHSTVAESRAQGEVDSSEIFTTQDVLQLPSSPVNIIVESAIETVSVDVGEIVNTPLNVPREEPDMEIDLVVQAKDDVVTEIEHVELGGAVRDHVESAAETDAASVVPEEDSFTVQCTEITQTDNLSTHDVSEGTQTESLLLEVQESTSNQFARAVETQTEHYGVVADGSVADFSDSLPVPSLSTGDAPLTEPSPNVLRQLINKKAEEIMALSTPRRELKKKSPSSSSSSPSIITPAFIDAELAKMLPSLTNQSGRRASPSSKYPVRRGMYLESEMDRVSSIMLKLPHKVAASMADSRHV